MYIKLKNLSATGNSLTMNVRVQVLTGSDFVILIWIFGCKLL
jgi:hypothetical protein